MCIGMGRRNVYLPQYLDELAKQYELPLSRLLQAAVRRELARLGIAGASKMNTVVREPVEDTWN